MKKLLFLVNVDWFFLSHRLPIALAALEQGYEVHIATGITDHHTELSSYGFTVHPLPISRGKSSLTTEIAAFTAIVQVFKKLKPDVVHTITIKPVLYGGIAAHFTGIQRIVAAISGLGYVFTNTGIQANIRRWFISTIYRFALSHQKLRVIFQNPDDQTILLNATRLSREQTQIISGSGIDLIQYNDQPLSKTIPTIVMASRLLSDKGVNEFIEAADILHKKGLDAQFQLAGNIDPDNPASITQATVENWRVKSKVDILGHRGDIAHLFSQAHIVVLPSYREGFPKVLIEAAACGRAVVTTDVPGCRDAIIPNVTGLLIPPRNAQALADAIEQLLLDPERCAQMGKAGRKLAEEHYSIEQVVQTHLAIYQELLNQP
jgi:glycosyltransferase involved in cell wall biosynthesis